MVSVGQEKKMLLHDVQLFGGKDTTLCMMIHLLTAVG